MYESPDPAAMEAAEMRLRHATLEYDHSLASIQQLVEQTGRDEDSLAMMFDDPAKTWDSDGYREATQRSEVAPDEAVTRVVQSVRKYRKLLEAKRDFMSSRTDDSSTNSD